MPSSRSCWRSGSATRPTRGGHHRTRPSPWRAPGRTRRRSCALPGRRTCCACRFRSVSQSFAVPLESWPVAGGPVWPVTHLCVVLASPGSREFTPIFAYAVESASGASLTSALRSIWSARSPLHELTTMPVQAAGGDAAALDALLADIRPAVLRRCQRILPYSWRAAPLGPISECATEQCRPTDRTPDADHLRPATRGHAGRDLDVTCSTATVHLGLATCACRRGRGCP